MGKIQLGPGEFLLRGRKGKGEVKEKEKKKDGIGTEPPKRKRGIDPGKREKPRGLERERDNPSPVGAIAGDLRPRKPRAPKTQGKAEKGPQSPRSGSGRGSKAKSAVFPALHIGSTAGKFPSGVKAGDPMPPVETIARTYKSKRDE